MSSFAREVLALKELLTSDAVRLLVLADEFARTTNPREGKALVVALLERLRARGACGLAATHLEGVAEAAGARHFAVRGLREIPAGPAPEVDAALAALAGSMDYRLSEVTGDATARADAHCAGCLAWHRAGVRRGGARCVLEVKGTMDPLIITCAPVGAEVQLDQTPHLPHTPQLLGETARAVREAGGSILHIHCRNDDGSNTHDVGRFRRGVRVGAGAERFNRAVFDGRRHRHDAGGTGRACSNCVPKWRR